MSKIKVKDKFLRIRAIFDALQKMDAFQRTVTLADGTSKEVLECYALGATRLTIARNINLLKTQIEVFDKARDSLVREMTEGGDTINAEHPKWKEFREAFEEMLNKPMEITLYGLPLKELRIDINPFPVLVLSGIEPILEDDDAD